jgi:AAA+ superfamily predicted ATPase
LANYLAKFSLQKVINSAIGLSHAEITSACNDALKETILNDKEKVTQKLLLQTIIDRKNNM